MSILRYEIGISNGDVIPIGTNSFMYGESLLWVQTLSGYISLALLGFFLNYLDTDSSLFTITLGVYQIMAVWNQFVLNFIIMVA